MASTPVLLLQLLLVTLASASRHYGGSMSFTYKGRSQNGTYQVDIRTKITSDRCNPTFRWHCDGGNCGSVITNQRGVLDKSTNAPKHNRLWCETETITKRDVPSSRPFKLRTHHCCWIYKRTVGHESRLLTSINLATRSDTGKPNSSPDVATLPFLRVPQNCPRTYKLTTFDPDGDKIRCRYGSRRQAECGSCNQPSGFFLDEESCTLNYQSSKADPRVHGFELMVEDYPQRHIILTYSDGHITYKDPLVVKRVTLYQVVQARTIPPYARTRTYLLAPTPPLSKLPLQFSFLVDLPAPSCQEGHYLAKFVHPTPENGAHLLAEVNKEVEIRVKAQATHTKIVDIIISGPLYISKQRTAHDEFVIRWKPIADDLNNHYMICFAVESVSRSGIYQSEMRCVVVHVVEAKGEMFSAGRRHKRNKHLPASKGPREAKRKRKKNNKQGGH